MSIAMSYAVYDEDGTQAVVIEGEGIDLVSGADITTDGAALQLHKGLQLLDDIALPFRMQKCTTAVTAPGAGKMLIRAEAGTNSGTLKLVCYAGTSTTGVTLIDNVGAGN